MSDSPPKRVQRFGPEPWREIAGRQWSLWDLWFCVIARRDHDGDLGVQVTDLARKMRTPDSHDRHHDEAMMSHLVDLRARLDEADLVAADLADDSVLDDRRIGSRAREKVTGRVGVDDRSRTSAMAETPRKILTERAMRGHWSDFPSNPEPFYEKFRPQVERKGWISKSQSMQIASRIEKRLADLDGPRRSLPDRLALYRAFYTAGMELAYRADDSFGSIGMTRHDAWLAYLEIDWRLAGMEPAAYWRDLCELRIWEDYGLDRGTQTQWFSSATRADVELIVAILVDLEHEHRDHVLDYEADDALKAIADLLVTTRSRGHYVDAAGRLGSRSWQPIAAMAKSQLKAKDRAGAVAVFRAADQPGSQQDHLRQMCQTLTGVDLTDDTLPS